MHIYVGFDPRERETYEVCKASILNHSPNSVVHPIHLDTVQIMGLYRRPFTYVGGKPYDPISRAPMSTEFAISRFLVPWLARADGINDQFILFTDCDMLMRCDIDDLLQYADEQYAVQCVKHEVDHGQGVKMDGCEQTMYFRKNWSSVMLWNLKHEGNRRLTLEVFNTQRGLWLHSLLWLESSEVGGLPKEFNHLVNINPQNPHAKIVHMTLGVPIIPGYEQCEYSDEWLDIYNKLGR
jgi:hypothetical protein